MFVASPQRQIDTINNDKSPVQLLCAIPYIALYAEPLDDSAITQISDVYLEPEFLISISKLSCVIIIGHGNPNSFDAKLKHITSISI